MGFASFKQHFQDWFTQQWVILWGRKISPSSHAWLLGPFGSIGDQGEGFIYQLAQKEGLDVQRNCQHTGILPDINALNLPSDQQQKLAPSIADFYEKTAHYDLKIKLKWNPFFKGFGYLVHLLFGKRIKQLNIPISNDLHPQNIRSEIIQLLDPTTQSVQHTFWLRTYESNGDVLFSGLYGTGQLPTGETVVKVVFPLPQGNATVLLTPCITTDGQLLLQASGTAFGEAGFYFLLHDTKKQYWAQYIASFTDQLVVNAAGSSLKANQQLKLAGFSVLTITYILQLREQ